MRRLGTGKRMLLGLLGLGLVALVLKSLSDAGSFDKVWNHNSARCQHRDGPLGIEDFYPIPGTHKLILSALDRAGRVLPEENDGLYLFDLDQSALPPRRLIAHTAMAPHGVSGFHDAQGTRLFVINHAFVDGDRVDIFDLQAEELIHVRSVAFPGVRTLNDLIAIDRESFFASQDLGFQNGLLQELEKFLRLPLGKIWVHDGQGNRIVADGLAYADGLELSADRKTLYATALIGRRMHVYQHNPETHALQAEREVFLNTAPDNVMWMEDGRLLIGTHLNLLKLGSHMRKPKDRAPWQVLAWDPKSGSTEELYASDGEIFSAVSTGLVFNDQLIMGAVLDPGLMLCKWP